ncbi:AraC family transcriptional regulator [Marinobacter mobilis]|uniref:AraC-type DNA-binding protein n=1 Tax=Marinobacter mobilis TaxID=488533 RepID=A0A1H2XWT3_9GAMM|nr:AraC family transcriptional regulator [Marinobacter mobilis]SDW97412.1 AraC-type DNA-binding protein [Marinobacter mobilis]
MHKTDLTRASSLARFDEFCAKYDLDYQAMLRQFKLPLDLLEQPDSLISYSRMTRMLEHCAKVTDNPLFNVEYGVFQGASVFGRMLYLLKNAQTVGDSLTELMHYYHLHSNAGQVTSTIEGKMVIVSYEPVLQEGIPIRPAVDVALGVGKSLFKMLLGSHWQPAGVHFRSGPSCPPQNYKRILGITPQFNSTTNGWVFESRLLDLPLSDSDPALHSLMQEHLEKMDALSSRELPAYLQQLIKSLLPNGRVTIDLIANYMMLSPRSLQRYLSEEGTSFQKVLDETRQSMAQRYLRESAISLTQLAGILGYSDLPAFSRAFQRWYQLSPREWRKEHGIGPSSRLRPQRQNRPNWLR